MSKLALFLFVAAGLHAAGAEGDPRWDFRGAIGTAGIDYGSNLINKRFKDKSADMSRIVLALDGLAEFKLSDPVHLVLGLTTTFDLNFGDGLHQHYFDYGFMAGFRYIPLAPWLSFEAEYVAGQRYDFISIGEVQDGETPIEDMDGTYYTPWSNGFRLGAECMLGYLTYHIVPIAGVNWRWMPRTPLGSDAQVDKIFTLYLAFRYQKNVLTNVNRRPKG